MNPEYIDKQAAIKELCETYEHEYPTASGAFDEYATRIVPNVLRNLPPADVVPWSFLERYADWFCALVQYPEFIREAKRFYLDSIGAMEGGVIDG